MKGKEFVEQKREQMKGSKKREIDSKFIARMWRRMKSLKVRPKWKERRTDSDTNVDDDKAVELILAYSKNERRLGKIVCVSAGCQLRLGGENRWCEQRNSSEILDRGPNINAEFNGLRAE
jgi:hypothetical protein